MNMLTYFKQPSNSLRSTTVLASLLVLSAGLLVFGCDDFLTEEPKGQLSENVIANQSGVEKLLIGAYGALNPSAPGNQGVAGGQVWRTEPAHWAFGSISSDVAHKGSIPNDQAPANDLQEHNWGPENGYFDPLWSNRFEGVSRANTVLQTLGEAPDISESAATRIEAEARFLRAYFYFDLKKNFGNVPIIDEDTEEFNQPNNINEEIIWPLIESDLEFAMNNLPEVMPEHTRANKWTAASFLAKAYVYQEKWSEAKPLFDDIIQNGVTAAGVPYALEEQYSHNFNAARQGENNSEIIFAVEMTANDGTGSPTNAWNGFILNSPHAVSPWGCCGFFLPSHDLVNSFKTTDDGLPRPDGFTEAFNNMEQILKNDQGMASTETFTPNVDASLDPRLDWTVGRRGVPYYDFGPHPGARYIRGPHEYSGPFSPKKNLWWNRNSDIGRNTNGFVPVSAVDYVSMRFADLLLLAAEAEIEVGSVDQARQYVNRVRSRAANSDGFVKNSHNEAGALDVVDSESAMLNTDPQQYDWVIRTDEDATYVFLGGDSGDISNWNKYPNPTETYNIDTYSMNEFQSAPGPRRRVHFERKLELAMEGHRFYDLARWDRIESRMSEFFQYEGDLTRDVSPGNSPGPPIYPIPQTQIDISVSDGEQVLQQNPQY